MPNLFESAERLYRRIAGTNTSGAATKNYGGRKHTADSKSTGGSNSSPFRWAEQNNYSARSPSSTNLATSEEASDDPVDGNVDSSNLLSPRAHPPGDLTAVSSSSSTSDNDAAYDEIDNTTTDATGTVAGANNEDPVDLDGLEPQEAYRRNQHFRRSIQKAQASRSADFEDRITVPASIGQSRYPSDERVRLSASSPSSSAGEDEEEEEEDEDDEEEEEGDGRTDLYPNGSRGGGGASRSPSTAFVPRTGVQWPSDSPQTLLELMPKMRCAMGPQTTQFVRAICQRSSCRCLLRGHDTLMLFPLFDAILCEATWEKILDNHNAGSRSSGHFLSRLHSHVPTSTSETVAKLIMFRQCRGWYEVMNENHEAVPHWTTVEDLRRARPPIFLVRRELRCLVAPQHLWLPPVQPPQAPISDNCAPPPVPISSSIVSEAMTVNAISSSAACVLKPGTLLTYVDFLSSCSVKRGKKVKQLPLVLAVEKQRSTKQPDTAQTAPRKLYYLGTEEASSLAVFPPKLALSPLAGPENISGVHMLSSLLRKFRLPLSISPVAVPERRLNSGSNVSSLSGDSGGVDYATAQSSKPVNIFPTVPGISFTERNFIRLRALQRGDILIVAPIDAPDRFFLITPTLLQDHLFQIGFSEDPIYHRLAASHRNRTTNFLSTAHPRESLSYLLRYLKNVTNEPRPPISSKFLEACRTQNQNSTQNFEISSALAKVIYKETGRDPRVGPDCNFTPEQVDQVYEELDDLYFFTRNGYFPPKNRQRRVTAGTTRNLGTSESPSEACPVGQRTFLSKVATSGPLTPNHLSTGGQRQLPIAEQLLAASLNISTSK
ncbi:hypothetical protein SprV_0501922600 [Sparganum proliferum]